MEYYGSPKDIVLLYAHYLDIDKPMVLFCNHTQRCQHRDTYYIIKRMQLVSISLMDMDLGICSSQGRQLNKICVPFFGRSFCKSKCTGAVCIVFPVLYLRHTVFKTYSTSEFFFFDDPRNISPAILFHGTYKFIKLSSGSSDEPFLSGSFCRS